MSNVIEHLDKIAHEAGLAVMGSNGILGILHDRETVSDEYLLGLTADDVADLYEAVIAPAIDTIEYEGANA